MRVAAVHGDTMTQRNMLREGREGMGMRREREGGVMRVAAVHRDTMAQGHVLRGGKTRYYSCDHKRHIHL